MAGIVEIAVAGEGVQAAEVVAVVVGAAVAAEAEVVVTAVGMVATAGTAAAEGIKPRIAIYKKSKSPPCRRKRDKGGHPKMGAATWSRLFSFGKILLK